MEGDSLLAYHPLDHGKLVRDSHLDRASAEDREDLDERFR
jgi:hypothetical protein